MNPHAHSELKDAKYVVFVDGSRRYIDCTADVTNLVGYERSELLKLKIDDLSFNAPCVSELFEKYRRYGHQNGEYILKHKDGTPVLVHYKAWVFDDGCHAAAWEPAEEWEQLYLASLLEENPIKLRNKANAAPSAIRRHRRCAAGQRPELFQKLRAATEALCSLLTEEDA
ncbi:MAG TPA: PAS domain-containing protein [Candidatus Acidoferrales bacterium]|jgi:PAS domain-containing protein|nr:PAS domain-containing protein [Candidatus Acidoferrales bacterium]